MAPGPIPFADLPPLTRRRLQRARRRQRRRVAGAVSAVVLLVVLVGVVVSRHDASRSDASARVAVRSGAASDAGQTVESTAADSGTRHVRLTAKSPQRPTTPSSRPKPTTTLRATTSTAPPVPPTPPPSSNAPPRQPPLTPPVTQGPADGGIDPQSPPATEPAGAQGAIRSTPCGPTGPPKIK